MTYYDLLGVAPSATGEEIRAAYRARARVVHPDTGGAADGDQMALLNEAWHVLGDRRRRDAYDAALGRQHTADEVHDAGSWAHAVDPEDLRGDDAPDDAFFERDAASPSSVMLLRGLVLVTMALSVAVLVAIVVIGFLQGP